MPARPTSERLLRMLIMVPWVIAHRGEATVEEVCRRFDVTREQLSEDLELLGVCGFPPFTPDELISSYMTDDRVVIDVPRSLQGPPRLTHSEALSMLVMGRAVARLEGLGEAASLASALDKLAEAITPGDAETARALADRIDVDLGGGADGTLATIREAWADHRRIHIEYFSGNREELTQRDIDPLLLCSLDGHWYVIADDHDSGEERMFRLDRIRSVRVTDATFEPREDFDGTRYDGGFVFTPTPRDLDAVIELDAGATWLRDVLPSAELEQTTDGRARLRVRTAHLPWLVRLVLSSAGAARAIAPPAFVDAVRTAASEALARYA